MPKCMDKPQSANEDGACTVVLGGADGKAISSSWQLNTWNPLGKGGGLPPIYVCLHKVRKVGK